MIKPLFKATQVAPSPAFTGSIVRKRWLKTPHSWLNLSAILSVLRLPSCGVWGLQLALFPLESPHYATINKSSQSFTNDRI
ncbi:hypothetical protein H4683_003976 [Filibacter limicola]|uniref:Uncharacterized protein n=1 Tax=Sporosarcina limicola TaxID=34101 RepID=A0A927MLC8_9BACL|nr:hypothetical protein [Sporosarcina limicola]